MTSSTFKDTKSKRKYKVTNWSQYNRALVDRGSLTLWIGDDVERWWYAQGRCRYTAAAIEAVHALKETYHLPLRQAVGLARSVFEMAGVMLSVPDAATICRRAGGVNHQLRNHGASHTLILDSTGAKIRGEGEWKTRTHGRSRRRRWKKIHLGINECGEIQITTTTENGYHDSEVAPDLIRRVPSPLSRVVADGAYDRSGVYTALTERGVSDVCIPPREDARIWYSDADPPHPRDANVREIRATSREHWRETHGYHIRSLVEVTMGRLQTTFGNKLRARSHRNQGAEVRTRCVILNAFHALGMPHSVPVASPS
jgi:hypothetical protein